MKPIMRCGATLAALLFLGAAASADSKPAKETKPAAAFEKMKALVGEWQGKNPSGAPVKLTYTLISDGSALMENLAPAGESNMVTIYHPDGGRLMMTHYCAAHNQPRMRAEGLSSEGKTITFNFVDATNLASPDAGRMDRLVLTFVDPDHLTQEWTWKEKGAGNTEVFKFEKVR